MTEPNPQRGAAEGIPGGWLRPAVFVAVALVVGTVVWVYRDELSLERLAAEEAALRDYQRQHGLLTFGVAFAAYVVIAALSIPAATAASLAIGWLFGFWRGVVLVSFASTLGATLAFLLSRHLLRDIAARWFQRWIPRITEALERDGPWYLFAMRLTPAVPFVVINVVMGLTRLQLRTFWWVSQLGMLPATCLIVYAGSRVPTLSTLADRGARGLISPPLVAAFVLLGVFPLLARAVLGRLRRER